MIFADKSIVEQLRCDYPAGTRVRLVHMDDPQAPPAGTEGTVQAVDDTGSICVRWDNGSGLNIIFGEDKCEKIPENKTPAPITSGGYIITQEKLTGRRNVRYCSRLRSYIRAMGLGVGDRWTLFGYSQWLDVMRSKYCGLYNLNEELPFSDREESEFDKWLEEETSRNI